MIKKKIVFALCIATFASLGFAEGVYRGYERTLGPSNWCG